MARLPSAPVTPRPGTSARGRFLPTVLGLALAAGLAASAVAQTPGFRLIEGVPGSALRLYGLSADGRTAAGFSWGTTGEQPGCTWSADAGRYDFGHEAGLPHRSAASAISGDGRTVVGDSQTTNTAPSQAFRWSGPGTFQTLAQLPLGNQTFARGVSGDGSVIVGYAQNASFSSRAVRWTSPNTVEALAPLWGESKALGISRDGTTIVGTVGSGTTDAFTWTQAGGLHILPWRPGAQGSTYASAVNLDGSVIVGESDAHGVLWRNGQVNDLGLSPGNRQFSPDAVNDLGTVVVGISFDGPPGGIATVWTPERGVEYLADFLAFHGVTVPDGWSLFECTAVSADGMTFAGWGHPTSGSGTQAFVATIPGPGPLAVGLAALCSVARRRRPTS